MCVCVCVCVCAHLVTLHAIFCVHDKFGKAYERLWRRLHKRHSNIKQFRGQILSKASTCLRMSCSSHFQLQNKFHSGAGR